jgi:Mg2+-importing ATPase
MPGIEVPSPRQPPAGLTAAEAARRLAADGPNVVPGGGPRHGLRLLGAQIGTPLVLVLIVAATLSWIVGERTEASVILLVVALNALLGFVQEHRAERALRALQALVTHTARVRREGAVREIPAADLVRGDLVELQVGDLVPADLQLIAADEISANEAALTGESAPVPKGSGDPVRLGTDILSGYGTGIVVATGRATSLGRIAAMAGRKTEETEFQRGLRRFGGFLLEVVLALTVFVCLANAALGRGWLDALLFALALAVGITPEVLPAIVTITLARGALRMARDQVVVKRLISVEDLGNIDTLCCDKTGTLTSGEFSLHRYVNVEGAPDRDVLAAAALAGSIGTGRPAAPAATPTDGATWRHQELQEPRRILAGYEVIDRNAFDFRRRRASALVERGGRRRLVVQGAPESTLDVCATVERGGARLPLSPETRAALEVAVASYEAEGYRVLAVAGRDIDRETTTAADEVELVLHGFLLYLDPPKPDARAAIERLGALGVGVKVLSGDSPVVARRICLEVGLGDAPMMTGDRLSGMDDAALRGAALRHTLFARVSPDQKQRLVAALRSAGHVVGFLGDGVNDAPALRAADVGISVDSGTEVAKEAADIVLLRKSLAVLAGGIVEGRRTFANITKYILNTISANFGNMATVAAASLFLPFLPLLPSQILLCNFLSDLPLVMIATDQVDPELLHRPRRWHVRPIARFMVVFGTLSAVFDLVLIGGLTWIWRADPAVLRTAWFVESVCSEVLVTFAIRTGSRWYRSRAGDWLILTSIGAAILAFAAPHVAAGQRYFGFVPLPPSVSAFVAGLLLAYFIAAESIKGPFLRRFGD